MAKVEGQWPDVHVVVRQLPGTDFQVGVPTVYINGVGLITKGTVALVFDGDDELQCVTLTLPVSRISVEDAPNPKPVMVRVEHEGDRIARVIGTVRP